MTTNLDEVMSGSDYEVYFDAQITGERAVAVKESNRRRQACLLRKARGCRYEDCPGVIRSCNESKKLRTELCRISFGFPAS